ncbi:prolyl oligopeptidase family serine peptidase [Pseudactinotalea terrae]|uniref:S9 family peptidase n=1 Tax=Pseudactinotalea terrae TaxID=1743262 RepID=UPI0019D63666|nr:prolyl oligopeptidase family serine peptidase [Pseudactinotalea terrae]
MSTLPYGSWRSPLHASDLAGASVRLSEVAIVGADTYWTEGRASEQGRTVLLRRDAAGAVSRVSPEQAPDGGTFDVRSRAQEYGGGTFAVTDDLAVASRKEDDRLYRFALDGAGATPLTPADGARYADLAIDVERGLVYAVSEDHGEPGGFRTDPTTTLVAIPLDGSAADSRERVRTVFEGTDFVNAPRLSLDGDYLAFVTWDHPNMPWDGSSVRVGVLTSDGTFGSPALVVAGGDDVSAQEPVWTPAGDLVHVDDSSGWWNLYRTELQTPEGWLELRTRHLHPAQVEFSAPQWAFGPRTLAVLDEDHLVLSWVEEGRRRLGTMRLLNGELEAWIGDWEPAGAIAAAPDRVVFVGSHPRRPGAVVELELAEGTTTVLATSTSITLDDASVSEAESVSWDAGAGAEAHGFYYPPTLAGTTGPEGELPPLLVMIHGGPTAATSPGFSPGVQYWTTRGFAVLDVNYGGSTGYGRAYRERLDASWGVVDVADCASGAAAMAAGGRADAARLAIRGGSAGGFTTLAALAFTDTFAAGTSKYGIGDLAALAAQTHKFEARYLDRLVGPYPEAEAVYTERSPLHHVERITAPVLLQQGSEDRVVPPSQSSGMAEALRARDVPVAYVEFAGEGHGFRGAEAITRALETELAFYGQVLGFEPAGDLPTLVLDA